MHEIAEIHELDLKTFLLQNHLTNFNQTWYKRPWINEIQICLNERPCPFPRVDNKKIVKIP